MPQETVAYTEQPAQEGGLPQLNPEQANFTSQLFWLAVTFAFLYLLMSRIALPRVGEVLQTRKEKIGGSIEEAAALSEEAKLLEGTYTDAIAKTRLEASELMQSTQNTAKGVSAKRHAELNDVLSKRMEKAEKKIGDMRSKAIDELATQSLEPTVILAKKIANVKATEKKAEKAISETIKQKLA